MEKIDRINEIFQQLVDAGVCRNKKEFAARLGVNYNGLTRAMNGDPQYLTGSLVAKATALLSNQDYYGTTQIEPDTLPILPIGARAGTIQDWADAIHDYDCERIVSPIRGASLAAQVTGDSMSPEYPSGSQIIVKKIDEAAFVQWGEVYLLDTDNGPILKQVRQTERDDVVECVSLNPAYQPFRVACKYIRGWYRVLMCLALK